MGELKQSGLQIIPAPGRPPLRRRQSLHDQTVEELRLRLLEGRISPGARIPESALCAEFGISRTPLREAMKVLAAEGLLQLLPHRGAVATEVTAEQAQDLFQVLASLENLVGSLAAEKVTPAALDRLENLHERMLDFHGRRRRADYFRLNVQIHIALAEIADNEVLLKTYFSLTQKAMRARYLANMSDGRWDESAEEHDTIMDALRQKDGASLASALVHHAENTGNAVVKALQSAAAT